MKFKVYTYDTCRNKLRTSLIGRYEIYNEDGEFLDGSGKRRVLHFNPTDITSLPIQFICNLVGGRNDVKVTPLDLIENAPYRPRMRRMYYDEMTDSSMVYEVVCE